MAAPGIEPPEPPDSSDGRWLCPRTGLVVVPAPTYVWRVYLKKFGPLNPLLRTGEPKDDWHRYDLAGHGTLYGASSARGAYLEALTNVRYVPGSIPFHKYFPDVEPGDEPIEEDWADVHMRPGVLPAAWRSERGLARIAVRRTLNFVDISAADSLGALRQAAQDWAPELYAKDANRIDMSGITGQDRVFTCSAARWLASRELSGGRLINGLRYASRLGADMPCWALWIRPHGGDVASSVTLFAHTQEQRPITLFDPDLQWAARQLGFSRLW